MQVGVGTELVKQLLADEHQVIGTTRQKEVLFDDANYSQLDLDITAEKMPFKTKWIKTLMQCILWLVLVVRMC